MICYFTRTFIKITSNGLTLTPCDAILPDAYQIYIGPAEPDDGGDALIVYLDEKLQLKNYEIERLEPLPRIGS